MLFTVLAFVSAYILGSISSSIILSRLVKGFDIRTKGSGNAGATNTFRVLGWKLGFVVLFFDIAKGAASILLSLYVFEQNYIMTLFVGFAAILGHIFPLFHGFKGGKGVATAAGVVLILYPWGLLGAVITLLVVLVSTGYVSLGSILGALVFLIIETVLAFYSNQFIGLIPVGLIVIGLIFMHRKNIQRLSRGQESRFEKMMIFKRKAK